MSHKKIGPDRFSRFDVYWIQTDKQTNRQAKFIYRLFSFIIQNLSYYRKYTEYIFLLDRKYTEYILLLDRKYTEYIVLAE